MGRAGHGLVPRLYHLVAVGLYVAVFVYDVNVSTPRFLSSGQVRPILLRKCGNSYVRLRAQALTYWDLVFQLTYFFICCVVDLVTSSGAHSPFTRKITAFRDWFLAAVAFPFGTLVVVMFWGIWAVDRELVFPKVLDEFFPSWLNHVMHTTVLPILVLDMFLIKHRYPSKLSGILGLITVGLSYLLWILWLGFVAEIWVYPILQVLSGGAFVGLLLIACLLLIGLYVTGEQLAKFFWRGQADYDFDMEKLE